MGLERRGSKTYYYKKRRLNGHVVSEYVGRGDLARFAALTDALLRRERLERTQRAQAERNEWAEQDAMLDRLEESLRLLVWAYFLTHGYHMHNGQWRRTRGKKK